MVCLGVIYLIFATDRLFSRFSLLSEEIEPSVQVLRDLVVEMREGEGLLGFRGTLEKGALIIRRAKAFERIEKVAVSLDAASDRVEGEARERLKRAVSYLRELKDGSRLSAIGVSNGQKTNVQVFSEALSRLEARTDQPEEMIGVALEVRRMAQFARATLQRATHEVLAGMREVEQELLSERIALSYAAMVFSGLALIATIIVVITVMLAFRPVRRLAMEVKGLACGGKGISIDPRFYSGETRELAEALEMLSKALQARDVDLERKKDELVRAERLAVVGRMASVVAHEVRNPLNSISLNLDLLRERLVSGAHGADPKVQGLVDAIQSEVDRLAEITEEYLKFGRLPKGVVGPCDVARLVAETLGFMDGEISAAGIEVTRRVPEKPVMVLADEGQLRQALVNVLRNAVEAMRGGGRLEVEVSDLGERIQVSVKDSGPGIPEDFRARLFEPFATTKPGGTGLGLAFVHQVMHECGGEVGIESAPGQGTCVRFRLRRAI